VRPTACWQFTIAALEQLAEIADEGICKGSQPMFKSEYVGNTAFGVLATEVGESCVVVSPSPRLSKHCDIRRDVSGDIQYPELASTVRLSPGDTAYFVMYQVRKMHTRRGFGWFEYNAVNIHMCVRCASAPAPQSICMCADKRMGSRVRSNQIVNPILCLPAEM